MKAQTGLLLLLLPLLAVAVLFAFAGTAVSVYRLPVSDIRITTPSENGMIAIDLAEYRRDIYLEAQVYPAAAYNRKYSVSVEGLSGSSDGIVTVEADGLVLPHGTGVAKITVTSADGGFTDSVTVGVYASAVVSLSLRAVDKRGEEHILTPAGNSAAEARNVAVKEDVAVTVPVGAVKLFANVAPAEVCPDVTWEILPLDGQPAESCSVNAATGEADFALAGRYAVITSVSPAVEGIRESVCLLDVEGDGKLSVEGEEDDCTLSVGEGEKRFSFFVHSSRIPEIVPTTADADLRTSVRSVCADGYEVTVANDDGLGGKSVIISADDQRLRVVFSECSEVSVTGRYFLDGELLFKAGVGATLSAQGIAEKGVKTVFEADGGIVVTDGADGNCKVNAEAAATGTVRLYVVRDGEKTLVAESAVRAIEGCTALAFEASSHTFGLENAMVAGGLVVGENGVTEGDIFLPLTCVRDGRVTAATGSETVAEVRGASGTAEGAEGGVNVRAAEDGEAVVVASWKYGKAFDCNVYATLSLIFVTNAVNVGSENDLRKAMELGIPAVLQSDIFLGERLLDDRGLPVAGAAEKQDAMLGTMPTSADWTYYANTGCERPEVRYCLEFTADVYGNGYFVDADNVTSFNASVSPSAHFDGPLYFVSLPSVASVTAQDNMVFLVRTDGVNLRNVTLRGCSDSSLYAADGKLDLDGLRYRGTVLEIMADCNVTACRISGGRTAVRVFGRDCDDVAGDASNANEERITVVLDCCVISCAREFLVKVGTNRKVKGYYDADNPDAVSPFLSADGKIFAPRDDGNIADDAFCDNFLLTDLTLRDCALYNSGLFAVGMECSFAGELLDGAGRLGSLVAGAGWKGLAGTSYAAVLRVAGDTRFYEWKRLSSVDSSTLIETYGGGSMWDYLNLDIAKMLHKVRDCGGDEYAEIIDVYEGEEYVHGGIAFYGGGKNYSVLDLSAYGGTELTEYAVNLSVLAEGEREGSSLALQGTSLPLAAGKEDFRFFVAAADSSFGVAEQESLSESGGALDFLYEALKRMTV